MIKAVCFDMDGVITNIEKLHYLSWKEAFSLEGAELSEEFYSQNLQSIAHKIGIRKVIPTADDKQIKRISSYKRASYDLLVKKDIEVFQDTLKFIELLYEKEIKMCVVSSSTYAGMLVKKVGLEKYFEFAISGTKGTNLRNKPYPDIYLEAMRRLNVNPTETLVVEDSINGIKSGLSSGAYVLGVNRYKHDVDSSEKLLLCYEIDSNEVIKKIL